jgi:cyclase
MLKKRIISCLDIKDGRTVKGVNFGNLKDAGDPVELARRYACQGVDELAFLDISATNEKRRTLMPLVRRIAKELNIPFTVGGGISSVDDAGALLSAGADKLSFNSAAVLHPDLIYELANRFGTQCVVVAIDAKDIQGSWKVVINGGTKPTTLDATTWAKQAEELGAGEILLTSMNHDGTKNGFALDLTEEVAKTVNIPVIASGGAGEPGHFRDLFIQTRASAALAASIFHFNEVSVPELKQYLKNELIAIR